MTADVGYELINGPRRAVKWTMCIRLKMSMQIARALDTKHLTYSSAAGIVYRTRPARNISVFPGRRNSKRPEP
jgi:hypothetical protein